MNPLLWYDFLQSGEEHDDDEQEDGAGSCKLEAGRIVDVIVDVVGDCFHRAKSALELSARCSEQRDDRGVFFKSADETSNNYISDHWWK